ncbi:MAG: tetratricopeptide repeat protein [Bacteroidetes bacterium]|nr:tetratricopeptide repeat protein [Bacteroidota bacterium]
MLKIIKHRYILITVILLLIRVYPSFAQSRMIDSLNMSLATANDTNKIYILIKLSSLIRDVSYQRSIDYVTEAKKTAVMLGYQKGIADAVNRLGNIFYSEEQYKEARDYYFEAMKLREINNDLDGLASSYHNLGLANYYLSDYKESLKYFNKSSSIREKIGDSNKIAVGYHNLADIHYRLAHFDEAIDFNKKALALYRKSGNINDELQILWQLGEAYFAMDKTSLALKSLQQGIDMGIHSGSRENELSLLELTVGKIYSEIDANSKAMDHFQSALNYSEKTNNHKRIKNIYLLLAQCSAREGEYQKAYLYHKNYTHLKDSIYYDMNSKRIENLRNRYDTRLKGNELETLRKNTEIELLKVLKQTTFRNYIIGFILIMLIGISFGYYNLKIKKKNQLAISNTNRYLENAYSKLAKSEMEHRQINASKNKFLSVIAHDLITPFNSLLGFTELLTEEAATNDREVIRNYSGIIYQSSKELYYLLENMLQWSRALRNKIYYQPETFNIAKTIDNVKNIISIQADKKNINITTDTKGSLYPFADENLVDTILRNLLNNAIMNTPASGTIEIHAKREDENIFVSVTDEGKGLSEEKLTELLEPDQLTDEENNVTKTGTGLSFIVVRKFVEKNNGKIFAKSKQGKGNIFTFTLPVEKR